MRLVFVHGWGFDHTLWDGVAAALPEFDKTVVELGFLGDRPTDMTPQADDVLIGHSLGLLWGMAQRPDWRAVIAVNGFARFTGEAETGACVPPAALRAMRLGVARDAAAALVKFHRSLGHSSAPTGFDTQRLTDGLALLETVCFSKLIGVPVRVLAARRDPLVPLAASEHLAAAAETSVHWHDAGGHLLPLTAAAWCAAAIAAFLT